MNGGKEGENNIRSKKSISELKEDSPFWTNFEIGGSYWGESWSNWLASFTKSQLSFIDATSLDTWLALLVWVPWKFLDVSFTIFFLEQKNIYNLVNLLGPQYFCKGQSVSS